MEVGSSGLSHFKGKWH